MTPCSFLVHVSRAGPSASDIVVDVMAEHIDAHERTQAQKEERFLTVCV